MLEKKENSKLNFFKFVDKLFFIENKNFNIL